MSLTQLQDRAAKLPAGEQRQLIAFLLALQTDRDPDFKQRLAAKIDDRDPAHWVELKDVQAKYGQ